MYIYGILSVSTIKQIGTYLGTPIFTSRRKVSSYQFIIDKIRNKIEGWQTRYLSVARRVTLIKSITNTIPIYSMQTTLLLEKTCKEIDRLNRSFFWANSTHHRDCHTISWEVITKPKEAGGLGIVTTRHRNLALLMNQAWHLWTNPDSLWAISMGQTP